MNPKALALFFFGFCNQLFSQNLVVDGAISSSNANWNGHEAPWNGTTYQSSYMAACGSNYVMEVDASSTPSQVVNGFVNATNYVLTFRYAYRTSGCGPSNNPTFLRIRFSDALATLDYTLSIPNTQSTFANFSYTFTNNASTSHTLAFTNLGNINTCGVIVDDISLMKLSSVGGIGAAGVSYWIKAESISLPDASNVYAWLSQGNNVVAVTKCADLPVFKTGLASAANNLVANYNPYLTFNGTNQYLEYTAALLNLVDNSVGGAGESFFSVYQGGSNNRTYFGNRTTTDSRTQGSTNSAVLVNGVAAGTNNNITVAQTTRNNIVSMTGKTNGLNVSDRNGNSIVPGNNPSSTDYLTVGVKRSTAAVYGEYFDGSLSEVIIFNTLLTVGEMQRVRSYLATKYGVTLSDNSSTAALNERTYLATDGTTAYWDYAVNTAYHNNVTIIGRDDATGLNQQKSISTDADAGSNTGNAMLIIDNAASISADKSFLAAGHNGTVIPNPGGANFVDVPAGIQSRLNRIWKFQKTGAGIANNVTVKFDMTGFAPLTGANLRLLVSNSAVFSGASIIAGAYAAPYFTASLPTTGGVYFTVASTNSVTTPLPITLLNFDARLEKEQAFLNWSTANELNSDYFTVERSVDAINFAKVGTVKAAANSNSRKDYQLIDKEPLSGVSYYRLKQTNLDATSTTYNTVSVVIEEKKQTLFSLYPNPGKGEFTLDFTGIENNHEVEIIVTDERGAKLYDEVFYSQTINHNQVQINIKDKVSSGVYFCNILFEGIQKTIKVVVK